jgi:acyl-CoA reductase-like NAD-dependent aldehyde dehydrogenase
MSVAPAPTRPAKVLEDSELFIGGTWSAAHSGRLIDSIDPATGAVWARVGEADEVDVSNAVAAARRAFESPPWGDCAPGERGKLLRRLGDLTGEHAGSLARLETRDNGKALRETLGRELAVIAEWFYYFGGLADKLHGETIPLSADLQIYTLRQPVGVVGAILPWNAPALMFAWKVAPALAAGNTVVVKPAELTSITALALARLVQEAGFPDGVVNVIPGYGLPAGNALAAHLDVDKVAFTGEQSTARRITEASVANLKRLSFELGGKAANIIFDDADYDQALSVALEAAFIATGQSCTAGSRILVQRGIYDRFVSDFVAGAQRIVVGDPLLGETEIGALASEAQLNRTETYVASAISDGAEVLCGGARVTVEGCEGGFFYAPTVIARVRPEMRVCSEEIFGPVATIMAFNDEDEAVALANDTPFGLTAGAWTNDIRRAHRLSRRLRAGTVWINTFRVVHWAVPYGGVKLSGYGRENGSEVMRMYTEAKTVLIDHRDHRPAWFGAPKEAAS